MFAPSVLETQQSGACGAAEQPLAPGSARSLRARTALQLQVLRGSAWVTLGSGPGGWCEASGDVVLLPGQVLCVPPGRHVVLEALGATPLEYRWQAVPAVRRPPRRAVLQPAPAQPCAA